MLTVVLGSVCGWWRARIERYWTLQRGGSMGATYSWDNGNQASINVARLHAA